ncbi:MAG: zinc-ribbon domain-containing protein [Lachnospiraceae bacterium]|nr:zinc-ribbon domain-containing protein [Lachnospiraceae bacterium]
MYCTKCGKEIKKNARFCTACGNSITKENGKTMNSIPNQNASPNQEMKNKKSTIIVAGVVITVLIIVAIAILLKINAGKSEEGDGDKGSKSKEPFEKGLMVGDTVYFGAYEQDNDTGNGKEPILWDVIGQNEKGFLLLSHYVLEYMPFQSGDVAIVDYATGVTTTGVTWESSSIRDWLNDDFMKEAFSTSDQKYIIPVVNNTSDFKETLGQEDHYINMQGGVGCANTKDNVFLLSIEEYYSYLNPQFVNYFSYVYASIDALAAPTKYARLKGASIEKYEPDWLIENGCTGTFDEDYDGNYTYWLLRNPGSASDNITVMSVEDMGHVAASRRTNHECGIRPAIWVSASANGKKSSVTEKKEEKDMDGAYSQCIGYWAPNTVNQLSADTFWLHAPQVMEVTESSVIIHGPNYSAKREDLRHSEKDGIDYFTSNESGFRFYYSSSDELLVLELKTENGTWMRWADFK